jgi:hypothetical protein
MTNLREELLIKEREIYDCKNELGLLQSKNSREAELRKSAEDAMKRNEGKYEQDAQKFSQNLRGAAEQNDSLSVKLSDAERNYYRICAEKKDIEENLSMKVSDLTNYKDRLLNENAE